MALTDIQMQAIQDAEDIDTGVDTRTKEERVKEQMSAIKSIGKGALFSPITGAADIVDMGAALPPVKPGTESISPVYSALEKTFNQLSEAGLNRENVVAQIKKETGIELKGDAPELIGEIVGLPAIAATKVATALFKAVGKSADEAKQLFRTASGGDDFDGMAPAVAGDVKAQTDQLIAKPDLPDTSISPNIDPVRSAQQEFQAQQAKLDDAELIQSRAESGPEYQTLSDFDADIAKAKNKNDGKAYKEFFEEDAEVAYIVELPDNKKAQAKKDWDNVKTVKEVDDWFKKYDTQPVRKGYNPEDPASRVFHLTKTDFDSADVVGKGTNDIGFHVGTAAQATSRGSTNVKYDKDLAEQMVKDERILPMVLKNKLKPARIIDVGSFKEPKNWIANLSVAKNDKQLIKFLLDEPADADLLAKAPRVTVGGDTYYMLPDVMRSGMDEKLWKDIILEAHRARRVGLNTINKQEDRVEWFNTLKQTANKNGYDSFVYKNEYEGASRDTVPSWQEELNTSSLDEDSYMLLEPDQAKGLFGGMTEGDPRYMKNEGGLMLQKGGAIPMDRQMSMFDEGGLEDDGGTVDPVSGNDVPPGSSKAEVRDDIPAQLSEGEFVFPADVVRYIGLEKLMMMRQQAKMGLKMMDEMGQMGNSDEATIPDDLPFNMMDLIIVDNEDEEEYNDKKEEKEMSEGGIVYAANGTSVPAVDPNSGVFYQPSQFAGQGNTPGVATVAPDAASRQFVEQARQSATPTVKYEKPETTYGDFLKPPQGGPQTITIVDSETGEKRKITFIPGVTEIPTGFVREEDYVAKEVVPEKETARVATTRVPTGDGENNDRNPGFATTDDTGIQYNSARLTEPLRNALRQYSMGPLTDASPGIISMFGESKVKSGGGQAAVVGGILDAFRGGSATFSDPSKMGRLSGEYEDKDPLHTLSPQRQNVIAASINRIMESPEIKDIFVDGKGNRRTEAYAIEKAEALAKKYGVSLTSARNKKSFNTLMREIAKAKEVANQKAIAKENARVQAQEQSAAQESFQAAVDRGESYGTGPSADGTETMQEAISEGRDPTGTAGAFTGEPTGMDDEYYNQGGLASKPKPKKTKKMKRGGLASKK